MPERGSSAISEVALALNPGRCAQGPGAVSTSVTEHRDRGSAGTPYHPLAEHFSHYDGESEMGALHATDDALEDRYAPLYGMPGIHPVIKKYRCSEHGFGADCW
jgi:hypothetical protein